MNKANKKERGTSKSAAKTNSRAEAPKGDKKKQTKTPAVAKSEAKIDNKSKSEKEIKQKASKTSSCSLMSL